MSEAQSEHSVATVPDSTEPPSIDELLVGSIARWALAVSAGIALFDLAILASYPFPVSVEVLRGVVYGALALLLLVATLAITFLGYRVVTTRIVGRSKAVFIIFLPAMVLLASLLGFTIMTSPK